jgi:hypothetical protein
MLADILVRTVDARHEEAQAQQERATERVPIDRATRNVGRRGKHAHVTIGQIAFVRVKPRLTCVRGRAPPSPLSHAWDEGGG